MGNQQHWDRKRREGRISSMLGTGLTKLREAFEQAVAPRPECYAGHDPGGPDLSAIKARFDAQLIEVAKELIGHRKFVIAMGPFTPDQPHPAIDCKECRVCAKRWPSGEEQQHEEGCSYAELMRALKS